VHTYVFENEGYDLGLATVLKREHADALGVLKVLGLQRVVSMRRQKIDGGRYAPRSKSIECARERSSE